MQPADLEILGQLGIFLPTRQTVVGSAITLDFQSLLNGQFWVVESASIIENTVGGGLMDPGISGFCIVPDSQAVVSDPANSGNDPADLADRGLMLADNYQSDTGGVNAYARISITERAIIPYGYHLRAVLANYNAAAPAGPIIVCSAMARIKLYCEC